MVAFPATGATTEAALVVLVVLVAAWMTGVGEPVVEALVLEEAFLELDEDSC